MEREEIKKLSGEFLRTYGYIAKPVEGMNAILFSRPTGLGVPDELLVYFHRKGEERYIGTHLSNLAKKYERLQGGEKGRRFFLTSERLGLTPTAVTENGFLYQVPVWFFDREFSEQKKNSPLKNLENAMNIYEKGRIQQPFKTNGQHDEDLLQILVNELENSVRSCIRVIIAPAGYGKTVLMTALYKKLLDNFKEKKKRQELCARPLMMLPSHIKRGKDLDDLINNFIGDEYDYGVINKEGLKFWITNNFAIWLLDGLEELILKIPEEFLFTILDEYVYGLGSKAPQIVISIRKPLLATSPELSETINDWKGEGIEIYELSDWGQKEKIQYFQKNLRLSSAAEIDSFINEVKTSRPLTNLCNVPYYCHMIGELRNKNELAIFNDETELVEYAFEKICEREYEKGLDKDICPVNRQRELFSELAYMISTGERILGETLNEYAGIYLPSNLSDDILKDQLACLQRHAILSLSGEGIDFIHDIMKQYLTSVVLLGYLQAKSVKQFDNVGEIECDSFLINNIIKKSDLVDWKRLLTNEVYTLLSSPRDEATGFRNIMKIYLSSFDNDKENKIRGLLQGKNLSGLIFKNLNMSGFSFEGSNLTNVQFINCILRNANLSRCNLKDTFISSDSDLTEASTKGIFAESIRTDAKVIYDQKQIIKFFYDKTKIPVEVKGPCQTVINFSKILKKLAKKGIGYNMPNKFLLQTKCEGGITAKKCVQEAIKNGYLVEGGKERVKIRAALFGEVERFLNNLELSDGIRRILDTICKETATGCKHVEV